MPFNSPVKNPELSPESFQWKGALHLFSRLEILNLDKNYNDLAYSAS